MEYYTLLTIVYSIAEHSVQFSVWFPSEAECWNVLLETGTIYDQVNGEEGYCDISDVVSKLVKPKPRPW